MSHTILTDVLIIFIVAVPVAFAFHKLKLSPIMGFLMTGAIIGPAGIAVIQDMHRIDILAQVGVALLVFSLGLEFSLKHFGEIKKVSIFGGLLQITLVTVIIVAISSAIGFSWREGLFLGCALSLSSTAIVYYLLTQKRLIDSPHGRISVGMLILQDLSAIPMVALLPLLISKAGVINKADIFIAVIKVITLLFLFVVGRKYILPRLLHQITLTRSKELFLITVLVMALGLATLTNSMGLSFALGAFLAGLMIADTDFRFHALSEIAPFRYCFNGLFFVSIGMLVHPQFLGSHPVLLPVMILGVST